jgi:hypothetical protein
LYKVSEDTIYHLATQRPSRSLVGIIHHYTARWPSCSMGWVPHHFLWSQLSAGIMCRKRKSSSTYNRGTIPSSSNARSLTTSCSMGHTTLILMRRRLSSSIRGSTYNYRITWSSPTTYHTTSSWVPPLTKTVPWRPMKRPRRRRERGPCRDPMEVAQAVLTWSTAWFTHHPWDNRADFHTSGVTMSSTSHSYSTTAPLLQRSRSRWPPGHHSSSLPSGTHATIVGRLAALARTGANPNKATHHELRHPWWTSSGAIRGAQRRGLATPTTPPWRIYPRERKYLRVCSPQLVSYYHTVWFRSNTWL